MQQRRASLYRVTLLNPKGGSGKTTIATNLASFYAGAGMTTAMFDYDAQGSSTRWLDARSEKLPEIKGVAAYKNPARMTRAWQLRLGPEVERLVVDTAAGVGAADLNELIRRTDVILIPVLPSRIDIDAVTDFIANLVSQPSVKSGQARAGLIANRVRGSGGLSMQLQKFLREQPLPHVATLRESSNYIRAAEIGCGIHDLEGARVSTDREQWAPLIDWIEEGKLPMDSAAGKQLSVFS